LLGYFILNAAINYFIYSSQKIELNNPRVLIVGDSHPTRSINPEFLSNAVNISQTAEPYILTYWKLQKVLKSNKTDILVVGFAPHNISAFNDFKFSDSFWSLELFKRSYPIHNFKEIDKVLDVDYAQFVEVYFKNNSFFPKLDHSYYIGEYSNWDVSSISGWKDNIQRHYYRDDKRVGISKVSIDYLESIIDLCQRNDIEVYLVSSPVHPNYYRAIPEDILLAYDSLKKVYTTNTVIFDRTNDFTYPDSLFRNSDHLNNFGAKRFTIELKEYMEVEGRKNNL
jgi:hypothetical protein